MIRNETFTNGVCVHAEVIDLDAGTYAVEEHGEVAEGPRPLTLEERRQYGPQPLEPLGAAMTLLAVLGVVPLADAANAVGLAPEQLVTEARAWAAAAELS